LVLRWINLRPVNATLEELGIDPDKLEWLPMPSSEAPSAAAADMFPREASRVLAIIAERRAALAQELGVPVEAIDIKLGPPPLQAA
jgi:hypothetical protein